MNLDIVEADLEKHGELHVVVEEHESVMADEEEDYIGLRKGATTFDNKEGVIRVNDGQKEHVIDSEALIYYHLPKNFPD